MIAILKLLLHDKQSRKSLALSTIFGLTYFAIHLIINIINVYQESEKIDITTKQMLGPFTISICSSLLIFSYSSFLSHAMRHLSILFYDVFFHSFRIFILAMTVIQVAGHAQILSLTDYDKIHFWLINAFEYASYFTIFLTFTSLFWLEQYQDRCFQRAEERLPIGAQPDASSAGVIASCTVASIGIGFSKIFITEGYGLLFLAEAILALFAIYNTVKFYAPLIALNGAAQNES